MKRAKNQAAILAAVALAAGAASPVLAVYSGTTTFQQTNPVGGPYPLDDSQNWSGGLPSATTLAIIPSLTANPANSTSALTAYGIRFDSTSATNISIGGQPLTLVSTDSVADTTAMTAPAIHYKTGSTGEFQINNNIILGDGSVTSGTAHVLSEGTRILLSGPISQAAGTTWGLTILPGTEVRFRAAANGGNYLLNRYTFTGQLSINAGGSARIFNTLLPHGAGQPNFQLDGTFTHSLNRGALPMNALNSANTTAIINQSGGGGDRELLVGANGGNGNFGGAITANSLRFVKIGSGTQTLTNATSAFQGVTMMEGVLSVDSISADSTSTATSALGRGNNGSAVGTAHTFAGTVFDGGTLKYTGAAHASSRAMEVSFRGGTIDASGTGALALSGTWASSDVVKTWGDNSVTTGTSDLLVNMQGLAGLGALASQLTIIGVSEGVASTAVGTTPVSIDESARTMRLAAADAGTPGSGFGMPRVVLRSTTGFDRTLTLTGDNTADNTLSGALANSTLGGKLNITKTGAGTWVLSGANTYTGSTTVSQGKLGIGATFTSSPTITVAGGATLEVTPGGDKTLGTKTLTVADGGLLAMNDNDFIVDYDAGPSPEFALRDKVKAIYQGGTSGISYTVGAGDTAIAVAEKTEWGFTSFNGFALDDTTVIGKYTYFGDANLDGKVTSDDYVAVDVGLGTGDSWVQGDFNFSGTVTSDDYVAIDVNLGKGSPTPLAFAELKAEMIALHTAMFGDEYVQKLAQVEAEGFAALVPEPGALSLVALGAAGLLGRRRRR